MKNLSLVLVLTITSEMLGTELDEDSLSLPSKDSTNKLRKILIWSPVLLLWNIMIYFGLLEFFLV